MAAAAPNKPQEESNRGAATSDGTKNPLTSFLVHQDCIINDGGMGTLLETLTGGPLDLKLWAAGCVLTNPDVIINVHKQYFAAGADIATTATYQATVEGYIQKEGAGITRAQAEDLIRKGVALAVEARDEFWAAATAEKAEMKKKRPLVAASVGCYGAALADGSEYRGRYDMTVEELMDWHRPRLAILSATDADLLAFETVPCEAELLAILRLLREEEPQRGDNSSSSSSKNKKKPCWISMACQDGTHLNSGELLAACARHVATLDAGPTFRVIAFGVNCTPPQHVEEALTLLKNVLCSGPTTNKTEERLLIAYPNSGEIWEGKQWLPGTGPCPTPQDFAAMAERWVRAGARIVGGCCRTTPKTIQALRMRLVPGLKDSLCIREA